MKKRFGTRQAKPGKARRPYQGKPMPTPHQYHPTHVAGNTAHGLPADPYGHDGQGYGSAGADKGMAGEDNCCGEM